jgi:hypothetical protein
MPAVETYFIVWKGRRDGPYSLDQLGDLLKRGDIGLLHRVETPAGLVPLKQLLPQPAAVSAPAATAEDDLPAPELAAHLPASPTAAARGENLPQEEALRVYTTCGLCFVLPPLAYRAWMQACELAVRGYPQTAQRLQWISVGLSAGGVVFWLVLGWLFFSRW